MALNPIDDDLHAWSLRAARAITMADMDVPAIPVSFLNLVYVHRGLRTCGDLVIQRVVLQSWGHFDWPDYHCSVSLEFFIDLPHFF